jgi:hypothetical protein
VPYGCADTSIGIVVFDLPGLLDEIAAPPTRIPAT